METRDAASAERRLGFKRTCQAHMTPEARRKSRIFSAWALVWALSFVGATLVLTEGWLSSPPLTWIVALAPTVAGLVLVASYVAFLRAADELLRKIHLEGLALGFGAGFLFMTGYRLLELIGAPAVGLSDPVAVFVLFWALGQWIGYRRYL